MAFSIQLLSVSLGCSLRLFGGQDEWVFDFTVVGRSGRCPFPRVAITFSPRHQVPYYFHYFDVQD